MRFIQVFHRFSTAIMSRKDWLNLAFRLNDVRCLFLTDPFFGVHKIIFFFEKTCANDRFGTNLLRKTLVFTGGRMGFLIGVHRTSERKIRDFPEKGRIRRSWHLEICAWIYREI